MPFDPHVQEQVAGRSLADAWLTLAGQANDRAVARSRRYCDFDVHGPVGALHLEGATPTAMGRFQAQPDLGIDVAAGHAEARRAPATAEEPLEEVAEPLLAAGPDIRPRRLPSRWRREVCPGLPIRAQLIVACALLRVRQDSVGLVQLLEARARRIVPWVDVRVVLAGELSIRLLDLVRAGGARDPEHFVVVPELHGHTAPPLLLGDPHSGGAKELVAPQVAAAGLVDYGSCCAVCVSNRGHGLVTRRVKGLANALERLHTLSF